MKNENEKRLFHGTSPESVEEICKENFDWRMCGKNATKFGEGSYFAVNASYSHNYATKDVAVNASYSGIYSTRDSPQFMFLAKVLVGSYTQGDPSCRRPPQKQPSIKASDRYDSCVDNTSNPTIFVIFYIEQCYPEYVIKYLTSTKSRAPRLGPNPVASQAAVSQPKAPNAHAIRTAASQRSRTSGAPSSLPPGLSLSYTSGLNTVGISPYNTASAFNSAKSSGYNSYLVPDTSRSQAHRATSGPNSASYQRHNTANRPRLRHAQSMPSVNQNRRSSRKKRRCSVM